MIKNGILYVCTALLMLAGLSCEEIDVEDDGENPYKALELTTRSGEFVRMGSTFTFDFIERVDAVTDKDFIISPLSMQFLLGMILDGARGTTAEEICNVLGYGAGEVDAVNQYCQSMIRQLPELDRKTDLSIASAIFVDDGWPLLDTYKKAVGEYYGAEVSNLDFYDNDGSLKVINGWCSDHTNGLVPKILDEVDPGMLAYLLNAMYFKSQWNGKFEKDATSDEDFTYESGSMGKVSMMKQYRNFAYSENNVFQAIRMPYGNGAFSMVAILPKEGQKVADVTASMKKADWDAFRQGMSECDVDLWLPRFETKFHINLNDLLSEMGMQSAFDGSRADFKAMSDYALCLSFVQQDAAIKVDEEGTEAAVVSSAGMEKSTSVGPGKQVVFHADHPFLYLITESSTGAILFAGKYCGK